LPGKVATSKTVAASILVNVFVRQGGLEKPVTLVSLTLIVPLQGVIVSNPGTAFATIKILPIIIAQSKIK